LTPAAGAHYDPAMLEHLGPRIRQLRKEKGLTLVEIAGKTGIAQATLSRIETGTMIGTVESHAKIAEILGVPLSVLYVEPAASVQAVHTPQKRPVHQEKNVQWELLTPENPGQQMKPVLATLQAGAETPWEQASRGSEKWIYMLEGQAVVRVDQQEYVLKTGETLYFEASASHQLQNPSGNAARLLVVTCLQRA
jgi:quercetin dioxygenase-like cupin family protein